MAEKKELKLTKEQNKTVFKLATDLKITPPELIENLEVVLAEYDSNVEKLLEVVAEAIDTAARLPWDGEEETHTEVDDEDGEKKTMLDQLAEELEMPPEDLKAKLEGMQVTANLSLEGAEEGDVSALLGLVAQTQEDHEALKADFEHLLIWANRRGYIKE